MVGKTTLAARLAQVRGGEAMFDPLEVSPGLLASDRSSAELVPRQEQAFVAFADAQPWETSALPGAGHGAIWTLLKRQVVAATTLSPRECQRIAITIAVRSASLPVPDALGSLSAADVPRDRLAVRADLGPAQRSCKGCRLDSMLWLPASSRRPLIRQ